MAMEPNTAISDPKVNGMSVNDSTAAELHGTGPADTGMRSLGAKPDLNINSLAAQSGKGAYSGIGVIGYPTHPERNELQSDAALDHRLIVFFFVACAVLIGLILSLRRR
jgi:hypothetical protein